MTHADAVVTLLAIKGFGKGEALAEALDLPEREIEAALTELIAGGLAESTRVGARLSAKGKAQAAEALERRRATIDHHRLEAEYERFIPLNSGFKQLVTDWQMRQIGGKAVRNDHSDKVYDDSVIARLPPLHEATATLIADVSAHVPTIEAYERRLANALIKFRAGDHRYFTAPDRDSYHTVWFEFHQDMIGLLGTTRAKEAAAGRAV
jgi:pyruvate, orthophosphate dikinase